MRVAGGFHMSSVNAVEPTGEPCSILPGADFKVIDAIAELLETRTRRQAAVDHAPETSRKAVSVLIASILLESGLDAGSDLVAAARRIVYATVLGIKSARDGDAALEMALAIFAPENAENPIGVHRTTVDGMLPALTNKEMDDVVKNQYKAIMAERKKDRAQPPKILLTFDSTSERVAAAHPNGTFSYVKPGGQAAWVPGFNFPSCYDATNQLFVGCCHQDPSAEYSIATKSLPPVVGEIRDKVATVTETGSDVTVIEADREYFKGDVFAAASLGLLSPEGARGAQPRAVIPRKFHSEKKTFTWEYLLDDTRSQVFVDYVTAAAPPESPLGNACEVAFEKNDKGHFLVPYACVALVGEWGQAGSTDLAELRAQAKNVQSGIGKGEKELAAAEDAYVAHYQAAKGKDRAKPSYGRGAKRTKFADAGDEGFYRECFRLHDELNQRLEKKASLLSMIVFMAVSLKLGEDPAAHANMFLQLARDYHERWGIESGFQNVKGAFLRKVRSAKPTRHQFNIMLGMLLYNWWHGERSREILDAVREGAWNKVSWVPHRPWVRRKLEQEVCGVVSARSFLIRTWASGIISLIQKIFKGEKFTLIA